MANLKIEEGEIPCQLKASDHLVLPLQQLLLASRLNFKCSVHTSQTLQIVGQQIQFSLLFFSSSKFLCRILNLKGQLFIAESFDGKGLSHDLERPCRQMLFLQALDLKNKKVAC